MQVESPIFQNLPRLPTPLGSFIHTAPLFRQLPLTDRATAAPLVKPLLEHDLNDMLYNEYDSQSAYELFRAAGVSQKLYDKFLAPMLLVTLFAPPTELSAAAALGTFQSLECCTLVFIYFLLLVTLFAPPTELSAAAALGACERNFCLSE
jgi:uncharacterized protein with NAD-binding domain and iron-sulfur cluster